MGSGTGPFAWRVVVPWLRSVAGAVGSVCSSGEEGFEKIRSWGLRPFVDPISSRSRVVFVFRLDGYRPHGSSVSTTH